MKAAVSWLLLFTPLVVPAGGPPMAFEPNVGQADSHLQYLARGKGYTLDLTASPGGAVVFSTYPGGSGNEPGCGIAVDASGVYVTGPHSQSGHDPTQVRRVR